MANARDILPAFIKMHGVLRFTQAQIREVAESCKRFRETGEHVNTEKLQKWAERNDRAIETLFQEIDMGAVATVINGLLSEITTLQGQAAAAQANSLDSSDQAALANAQNELTAWNASQSSGSGSSASGSGSASSGSGSAASGS
jgi:hypothetical protein